MLIIPCIFLLFLFFGRFHFDFRYYSPANPSLLGLNVGGGVQIKLRLRRPNQDGDFIPYQQVLDTMLHELSHNEHGPHNASFYKLWDELRKVFVFSGIHPRLDFCIIDVISWQSRLYYKLW